MTAGIGWPDSRLRVHWGQRHVGSIRRRDGHDIDGNPGDCFRCALAYVTGYPADSVPHFARYRSWWDEARRWVRWATGDRYDLYYLDMRPDADELALADIPAMPPGQDDFDPELVVFGGTSPRGTWGHCVAGRLTWELPTEFDPHPSGDGLPQVDEAFLIRPALPWPLHGIPERLAVAA